VTPVGAAGNRSRGCADYCRHQCDLAARIAAGSFRQVFISAGALHRVTPPLRERLEDVPCWSRIFFAFVRRGNGLKRRRSAVEAPVGAEAIRISGQRAGMKNLVERALIDSGTEMIEPASAPAAVGRVRRSPAKPQCEGGFCSSCR